MQRRAEGGLGAPCLQNPKGRGPDDPGLADKAEFPKEKQEEFQQYSWIPVRDTQASATPLASGLGANATGAVPSQRGLLWHASVLLLALPTLRSPCIPHLRFPFVAAAGLPSLRVSVGWCYGR